jgi:hypothetical protein
MRTNEMQIMQNKIAEIERKLSEQQSVAPITNTTIQTNTVINAPTSYNIGSMVIQPWGAPLQLTDADVEAALASIPCLAGTPAMTEVVAALMELVKRSHLPEAARNIHLNPKRGDQALALTQTGGWAAMPLTEATAALFDGASARIAAPAGRQRVNALRATVPVQYRADKAQAVQLGLRPMEAHLANLAPGGPGPLLLEGHAEQARAPAQACTPAKACAPAPQRTHIERVRAALQSCPLRRGPTGALLVDWIVAASQLAGLTGRELFIALEAGGPEFAEAWAAAQQFAAEKMLTRI